MRARTTFERAQLNWGPVPCVSRGERGRAHREARFGTAIVIGLSLVTGNTLHASATRDDCGRNQECCSS